MSVSRKGDFIKAVTFLRLRGIAAAHERGVGWAHPSADVMGSQSTAHSPLTPGASWEFLSHQSCVSTGPHSDPKSAGSDECLSFSDYGKAL